MPGKFLQVIFFSASLLLVGCYKKPDPKPAVIAPIVKSFNNTEVPEGTLTLNTNPKGDSSRNLDIEENLFGKFFCDRAQFYIIKNPKNRIYNSEAEAITLYYIDQDLLQTKYQLNKNIIIDLLRDLGNPRILGYDLKNRDIIKSGKIVTRDGSTRLLNEELDNYEMRWKFGNREVKYCVRSDMPGKFLYYERASDYDLQYKKLEKICL